MKLIKGTASALLSLAIAVLILMSAIRLLLTPVFYQVEYRLPYFPADPYGFTFEERLNGARISIDYLLNDAGLEYFDSFKLKDGSAFYNPRELSHMQDVKILVQNLICALWVLLIVVVGVGLLSWRIHALPGYWKAHSRGGLGVLSLVAGVLIFVLLSFSALFTRFHMLFFTEDTWMFQYSDTLIRLFPMQFWQDAFIWVGILSILLGLATFLLGRHWSK